MGENNLSAFYDFMWYEEQHAKRPLDVSACPPGVSEGVRVQSWLSEAG